MSRHAAPPSVAHATDYPLLGGRFSRAQRAATLVGIGSGTALALLYRAYLGTGDVAPDSLFGLGFAVAGTSLLLLVGLGFVLRKRLRRHWAGRLHTVLAWHMVGAVLGLALIFMHAAGNFNPRSGTYALYGWMAVAISGIVGRVLDRVCPRLAAAAALSALSLNGEDRLDLLEQRLSAGPALARPPRAPRASGAAHAANATAAASSPLSASSSLWDLAYHDLYAASRAVPILVGQTASRTPASHAATSQRTSPPRQGPLTMQRHVRREAATLRRTLGSERFLIQLVRVWRRVHTLLSVIAVGLLIWHLVYAATLFF
jgi:hypothetical protein